MKKIFLTLLLASFVFSLSAQANVEEIPMIMVDGVEAAVAFFKDWKSADAYIKSKTPVSNSVIVHYTDGKVVKKDYRKSPDEWIKSPVNFNAKSENEVGDLINKNYKETENEYADEIWKELKSRGCKYAIGFADLGDRYVRYMITNNGKKLTVNRYNYYSEKNSDYIQFMQNELAKEAKSMIAIRSITEALLSPIADAAVDSINASKSKNYKPTPIEESFRGHDGIRFKGYRIWYDNGDLEMDYIIDSNGNYRKYDSLHSYPIVKESIVPNKVKEAVEKMFN